MCPKSLMPHRCGGKAGHRQRRKGNERWEQGKKGWERSQHGVGCEGQTYRRDNNRQASDEAWINMGIIVGVRHGKGTMGTKLRATGVLEQRSGAQEVRVE